MVRELEDKSSNISTYFRNYRLEVLQYMDDFLFSYRSSLDAAKVYLSKIQDHLTEDDKEETLGIQRDAEKHFSSLQERRNSSSDSKSIKELKSHYYHFRHDIRKRQKELELVLSLMK